MSSALLKDISFGAEGYGFDPPYTPEAQGTKQNINKIKESDLFFRPRGAIRRPCTTKV